VRRSASRRGRILGINGVAILCILVANFVGAAMGVGLFTFGYADAASYLTNRPDACANCHVMREHLDAWVKSSQMNGTD
jgi:cytochrome c nitrite reductase small subunit